MPPGELTNTRVSSSENPSSYRGSVTFAAAVNDRAGDTLGGTVQFAVDGTNYGGSASVSTNHDTGATTATVSYTFQGYGNYTITANYSGDSSFLASSGDVTVNVIEAPK
jgi:hemolysin activation/secretion protein